MVEARRGGTAFAWYLVRYHHRHSILLVDDDEDVRTGVAELLRLDGYEIVEAADGQEALRHLRLGLRPCLVLLDLNMPRMSGWQFRGLQVCDREIADIPVVAFSGHESVEQQAKLLSLAGFLGKPLDFDKLRATVARTCRLAA
jgi:two-component system cell cycle response regulator DivK